MEQPIVRVNAFTTQPFAGNPAAVCILPYAYPDPWMQAVARELNLSEMAFLHREQDGYRLRWFTPKVEVELCGHATLASAHVLWQNGQLAPKQMARFYTRSGVLTATLNGAWITLDFPTLTATPIAPPAELVAALGLEPHAVEFAGRSREDYLIAITDPATLRTLQPNFTQLARLPVRGIIVTSPSDTPDYHFLSRFFAPACGVNEDPVTGSAHCTLAPYWAALLNQPILTGYQASARGGVVRVQLAGERVYLSGQAVTVLRGLLMNWA